MKLGLRDRVQPVVLAYEGPRITTHAAASRYRSSGKATVSKLPPLRMTRPL
jgi:hypothetical protein